jgi:hypothetical protein
MDRGAIARRLISDGEEPYRMLAAVVWPGRDWAEDARNARLEPCTNCAGRIPCDHCGGTGLVSATRRTSLRSDAGIAYA